MAKDLALEVLKQIRDELRGVGQRIDQTNERLDQTNERLDQTNERLDQTNQRLDRMERRQSESEIRLATELVGVVQAVRDVQALLAARLELRDRVEDHERRILQLENRP